MADQRPFSRFRLPWVTATPRPAAEPQPSRPPIEIQAPAQPTTTIPQRPFRPVLASVQSPPPPPRPQPPLATTESRVGTQPASLSSTTTQTRATTVPSISPKQQTVPQPQASSRRDQTFSQPSPPPRRRTTQLQPTVSQPSSPPKKSESTTQETSQPPPISAYQQEPKPATSSLFSQAAQPKQETVEKEKEIDEKEKKTNGPTEEESLRSRITELLAGPKQQEKEDTISSQGEHIKTMSSTHPKSRSKSTESHQKPREQVPLHKGIRDDISKFVHNLGVGQFKYPMDEKPVSVVTVAGENTGASMHVGAEPAPKDGTIHIRRGYKLNPDDSTGTTTDGEGSTKGRRSKNPTGEDQKAEAYVNSNTQSINNSIIFDSSVDEHNPGVHLALSNNPAETGKPSASDEPETLETHKAEFNVTPAQKLTYEPTIRRRCLRGLFLETSDSDNDNPEKPLRPRRHGCRYGCGEKSRDTGVP